MLKYNSLLYHTYGYNSIYIYIYTSVSPCIYIHGAKFNRAKWCRAKDNNALQSSSCGFERNTAQYLRAAISSAQAAPSGGGRSHFEHPGGSERAGVAISSTQAAPSAPKRRFRVLGPQGPPSPLSSLSSERPQDPKRTFWIYIYIYI